MRFKSIVTKLNGLLRDPADKHKLIIDPEAAALVREIFEKAIDGNRLVDIVRYCNEKGYDTPARYFQRKNPDKRIYRKLPIRTVGMIISCEGY